MGLRPMLYYYASGDKVTGCGAADCVSAVMLIGTPALWWLAIPVLGWGLWRTVDAADWRYAAVLVGYGAGVLPWFANIDRQMYFFYMAPVAPFLVLAIVLVMGEILGRRRRAVGAPADGPAGGRPVGRPGRGELRLAVADPRRRPDHAGRLGRAAVAAVVAPLSAGVPRCRPRSQQVALLP